MQVLINYLYKFKNPKNMRVFLDSYNLGKNLWFWNLLFVEVNNKPVSKTRVDIFLEKFYVFWCEMKSDVD